MITRIWLAQQEVQSYNRLCSESSLAASALNIEKAMLLGFRTRRGPTAWPFSRSKAGPAARDDLLHCLLDHHATYELLRHSRNIHVA